MPTPTEQAYAGYLAAHLEHCDPGQRIYTGVNAGECVKDGDVLAQPSTYPDWYSDLCTQGEPGGTIRRNLALVAAGQENRRGGKLTLGYKRVLRAIQGVMLKGCPDSCTPPDIAYMEQCGVDPDSIASAWEYFYALTTGEDAPAPAVAESLAAFESELPEVFRTAVPMLAPFASRIVGVGKVAWVKATDSVAAHALEQAGFKLSPTLGFYSGKPILATKLPARPAHHLPQVEWREYERGAAITF